MKKDIMNNLEQDIDYTLLGQRLEDFINAVVPGWFIRWFKKDGCNCDLRKDLLNNWHLDYRDYKQAVKDNKKDNYQIAKEKVDKLKWDTSSETDMSQMFRSDANTKLK